MNIGLTIFPNIALAMRFGHGNGVKVSLFEPIQAEIFWSEPII
jgi:hypothetical protein